MLQEEEKKYIINTYNRNPENNPLIVRGQGTFLWDEKGKQHLILSGLAVNAFGHAYPPLLVPSGNSWRRLFIHPTCTILRHRCSWRKCLVENSALEKTFCNRRCEANEAAMLARKYSKLHGGENKYEIITALKSFHGLTWQP